MKTEVVSKEELVKTIEEKDRQIQYLQEKLDYLIRQKFTSKSEKINYNQPSLFDDTEEEIAQKVNEVGRILTKDALKKLEFKVLM